MQLTISGILGVTINRPQTRYSVGLSPEFGKQSSGQWTDSQFQTKCQRVADETLKIK
jgi:hypothetical protein